MFATNGSLYFELGLTKKLYGRSLEETFARICALSTAAYTWHFIAIAAVTGAQSMA